MSNKVGMPDALARESTHRQIRLGTLAAVIALVLGAGGFALWKTDAFAQKPDPAKVARAHDCINNQRAGLSAHARSDRKLASDQHAMTMAINDYTTACYKQYGLKQSDLVPQSEANTTSHGHGM